ncbi:MAG: hypothetical protein DMD77_26480 [Candidatus Rokuibacteriota bacterium]|nr:MAG: hypothetical protein DMD77_26480 [Candidatus Rokubacteria bacterium]PYM73731.1 MAG: hypothetical protein DME10_08755 [Candidatus Rokubacteria bacterium]
MVPIEVRAFRLLAICVIVLAAVLVFQLFPRRAGPLERSVVLLLLALVIILGVIVLVTATP